MNVLDIRPHCEAECSMETAGYRALRNGGLDGRTAAQLLPDRNTLGLVWRYLAAAPGGCLRETPQCLCRKFVRATETPMSLGQLLTCLDIFADVALLELRWDHKHITVRLCNTDQKADLNRSRTMQRLCAVKER
jgi:hypothetical protein